MWRAIKYKGSYTNIYVQQNDDTLLIVYPPKQEEFIARHKIAMEKKGYTLDSTNENTYIYKK